MEIGKVAQSPIALSAIAIFFLLISCVFTIIYNQLPTAARMSPEITKYFLSFSLAFLIFFLISFIILFISVMNIQEIWDFISQPASIVTITSAMLICSYLSSVLNNYVVKLYGESSSLSQFFFILSITFFVFFSILFISMLVSFSRKFLFAAS